MEKKGWNRVRAYAVTGLMVSCLFLGICMIKGIFPFGEATLDTSDFEQQSVPIYYHMWDFLHGKTSLLFDWNVGGGNNFSGVASHFSLISPFNLFFFLIKRENIEPAMTFYVLLKLVAMGCAMCFFLQRTAREEKQHLPLWSIAAGSTAYALSGYTLQYYGFSWLDVAAVFPLLIYFLKKMTERECRWRFDRYTAGYVICLTLVFVMNIPQAYMLCFYLILFAGGLFFVNTGKKNRNRGGILKFGLGTLLSLGLSAVIFLPAAFQILGASRMSGEEYSGISGYIRMLQENGMEAQRKWIILLGAAVPLVYFLCRLRSNRHARFWLYMVLVMVLPVFVEAVNILWHKEPYVCFPMRYGYMLVFTVLAAAADGLPEKENNAQRGTGDGTLRSAICRWGKTGIGCGIWLVITLVIGIQEVQPLSRDGVTMFVRDSGEVQAGFGQTQTDLFHKIKLADASINSNYPLIVGRPSFSNYVHLMKNEQIALDRGLGYAQAWTRLSDTGGTLFSDALLGYGYTIDSKVLGGVTTGGETLYQEVAETEHFLIQENRLSYKPGLRVSSAAYAQMQAEYSENIFENQNELSRLFFGENFFKTWEESLGDASETVAEINTQKGAMAERQNTAVFEIPVSGTGELYLYSGSIKAEVRVNGTTMDIPAFDAADNRIYPAEENNGSLCLGTFSDETVKVELLADDGVLNGTVYFGILDLERFAQSTQEQGEALSYETGKNSFCMTVQSEGEEYLYLPIWADAGWHCTVNGRKTELASVYRALMLVPLVPGENEIVLEYCPRGMTKGLEITLAAAVILLLWVGLSVLEKKRSQRWIDWLYDKMGYVAAAGFFAVFVAFLIVVYLIPVGYTLYMKIPLR